jgi:hypothetical protein
VTREQRQTADHEEQGRFGVGIEGSYRSNSGPTDRAARGRVTFPVVLFTGLPNPPFILSQPGPGNPHRVARRRNASSHGGRSPGRTDVRRKLSSSLRSRA